MSVYVPLAYSYLNFPGDVTADLKVGQAMGPDWWGQPKFVVSFDYNAELDRTEVGMSPVRPL